MASSNHITKVAFVGAGGNSGSFMAKSLLATGKHTVTAITRRDSQTQLPDGVVVKKVDYSDHNALVEALQGQEALVITLGVSAGSDVQASLIRAAEDARVPWLFPNEWSPDTDHEGLTKDVSVFAPKKALRDDIAKRGKINFISVQTGFWYEWSLVADAAFGFDFKDRKATLFDDGKTKISTSTWPQVGRAVAAILSLPVKPEDGQPERCLQALRNKCVYVKSFTISQQDMFESVLRVTGAKQSDWKITREPSRERYAAGVQEMMAGSYVGLSKMMYTRVFFPDSSGDHETRRGVLNEMLGLPKEDLDEATKRAIKRWEETAGY